MPRDRKTFAQSFSITETTKQQLQELMPKLDMLSESEVMRRAVADLHRSTFPDYIYKKSAKDIKAREEAAVTKQMEKLDPISFAEQYIGNVLILPAEDGHDYMIVHGTANMLNAVRDDTIKEFYDTSPDLVELHQKKAQEVSVASELNNYMVKYLQKYFGILPEGLEKAANAAKEKSNQ